MGANRYPAHVRTLGCYAWKPLLLHELRQEFPHAAGVVWLDTAVGFHGPSPQTVRQRAHARVRLDFRDALSHKHIFGIHKRRV